MYLRSQQSFSLQTNLLNLTAPIEGYSVEDFVFAIDIPGGPSVNLTGSIQQVIHELNATYGYEVPAPTISPYDSFSNSSLTNMNAARASRASKLDRPSKTIGARATRTPTHGSVICDGPWGQTEAVNIISGIRKPAYLSLGCCPSKPLDTTLTRRPRLPQHRPGQARQRTRPRQLWPGLLRVPLRHLVV